MIEPLPLFSIIIPTYNSEKTLINCLESVLIQEFTNYEILIIDGLSIDNTLNIIEKYIFKYPLIKFTSEQDNGIYDAMNKGIDLAKGIWLYFLGSDDILFNKDVLSIIAKSTDSTDESIIYGNVIIKGENQWNLNEKVFGGEYDLEKILRFTICHQAIFYKKNVFNRFGKYHLKYIVNADYEFNLRCFSSIKFKYINSVIAYFFVGGQSTRITEDDFAKDRGAILMKYFNKRIFNKSFLGIRIYLRRAALSLDSPLTICGRLFCLSAYIKLKIHAIALKFESNFIK